MEYFKKKYAHLNLLRLLVGMCYIIGKHQRIAGVFEA